jgi:putative membrane protein
MKPTRILSAVALGAITAVGACMITPTEDNTAENREVQGRHNADGGTNNKDEGDAKTGGNVSPPTSEQEEKLATFTPAEVTNILEVMNLGEVKQGEIATQQAQNPEVKAFAQHMVEAHGKGQQRAQTLLGQAAKAETDQVRLARDPTAGVLLHQGEVLRNDLKSQTGAAFDLAYMTAQITAHAKVLALIDHSLLPSAEAPQPAASQQGTASSSTIEVNATDLQAELKTTRTEVVKHLVEALRIQQTLRNTTGATAPPSGTTPPAGGATPPPR